MAKPLKWFVTVAFYETGADVAAGNCSKKVKWEDIPREEQTKLVNDWNRKALERVCAGTGYKVVETPK